MSVDSALFMGGGLGAKGTTRGPCYLAVTPYIVPKQDGETLENPPLDDLPAAASRAPRGLVIFDYSFETMEPLAPFSTLERLTIQTAGKLTSLEGVGALT